MVFLYHTDSSRKKRLYFVNRGRLRMIFGTSHLCSGRNPFNSLIVKAFIEGMFAYKKTIASCSPVLK